MADQQQPDSPTDETPAVSTPSGTSEAATEAPTTEVDVEPAPPADEEPQGDLNEMKPGTIVEIPAGFEPKPFDPADETPPPDHAADRHELGHDLDIVISMATAHAECCNSPSAQRMIAALKQAKHEFGLMPPIVPAH